MNREGISYRPTTNADRAELKAAFRRLVRDAGGQTEAARATRVDQQSLSRYGAPRHDDTHAPADVIADLTIDTDNADVVRVLARIAGGVFVPLPRAGTNGVWMQQIADTVKDTGEAVNGICTALADDGAVSSDEVEALELLDKVARAQEALAVIDRHLRAIVEAGEGAKPDPRGGYDFTRRGGR